MTVSSSLSRVDYTGNGVTVSFPVPFRFLEDTHLRLLRTVIATGVSTELTLNSLGVDGYEVTGANDPNGGSVDLVTAPALLTERLTILRNVPRTQETDYIPNDPFPAESHERALDKLTMVVGQIGEVSDRSVVLAPGTVGVSTELPQPDPLMLLQWNAAGNALENVAAPLVGSLADSSVVDAKVAASAGIRSSKLRFDQQGAGAVPRTVEEKLRDNISLLDYGTAAEVVVDALPAFQRAIADAKLRGGAVIGLPPLNLSISNTVLIDSNNILLQGAGMAASHDVGGINAATQITWTGGAGVAMVEFRPVTGPTAQRGTGGGIKDCAIQGNNVAQIGVLVTSWNDCEVRICGFNCITAIIFANVVAAGLLGEARDCQFNEFSLYGRSITGAGDACQGIQFDGDTIANVSLNRIPEVNFIYHDGYGLALGSCDNNEFGMIRCTSSGGTGHGVVFGGSNVGSTAVARYNRFQLLSPGAGGVVARGTPSNTHPSLQNVIEWYDVSNGSPLPVIEAGASCYYRTNEQITNFHGAMHFGIGDSYTNAKNARDQAASESLRIINGASNHVRLSDGGANEWAVRMNGGDLELLRIAGAGLFKLNGSPIRPGPAAGFTPAGVIVANLATFTPGVSFWRQVGEMVHQWGFITVADPTLAAGTLTTARLGVGVPSNFGAATDAVGGCIFTEGTPTRAAGEIFANAANDQIALNFLAPSVNAGALYYWCDYRVI